LGRVSVKPALVERPRRAKHIDLLDTHGIEPRTGAARLTGLAAGLELAAQTFEVAKLSC